MKIGIISFAHMHAYGYATSLLQMPDVELVGIADDDPERGRKMAETFKTRYFAVDDLLALPDLDGVIICSENAKHRMFTEAAAKAGKHVLVEKPIATTIEDAEAMIRVCAEHCVNLQVAFPVRFEPSVRRLKELVDSGQLGRLIAIKASNHGRMPGGWFIDRQLSGGGAVMDHTVHVVDLIRWIFNTEITEVYAEVGTLIHDIDIDDCGLLSMQLANGAFVTLDPSWSRPEAFPTWGDVTMKVIATKGIVELDAFRQRINVYSNDFGHRYFSWGEDSNYYLIREFIDSIREKRQPQVTGMDGLRALEVALEAYESAVRGEAVKLRLEEA